MKYRLTCLAIAISVASAATAANQKTLTTPSSARHSEVKTENFAMLPVEKPSDRIGSYFFEKGYTLVGSASNDRLIYLALFNADKHLSKLTVLNNDTKTELFSTEIKGKIVAAPLLNHEQRLAILQLTENSAQGGFSRIISVNLSTGKIADIYVSYDDYTPAGLATISDPAGNTVLFYGKNHKKDNNSQLVMRIPTDNMAKVAAFNEPIVGQPVVLVSPQQTKSNSLYTGKIYITTKTSLHALTFGPREITPLWSYPLPFSSDEISDAGMVIDGDGAIIISSKQNGLVAVTPQGEQKWVEHRLPYQGQFMGCQPVIDDNGLIYSARSSKRADNSFTSSLFATNSKDGSFKAELFPVSQWAIQPACENITLSEQERINLVVRGQPKGLKLDAIQVSSSKPVTPLTEIQDHQLLDWSALLNDTRGTLAKNGPDYSNLIITHLSDLAVGTGSELVYLRGNGYDGIADRIWPTYQSDVARSGVQTEGQNNVPRPIIKAEGKPEANKPMTLIGNPTTGYDGAKLATLWKQLSQYGTETKLPDWAVAEGNRLKLTPPANVYAADYRFRFNAGDKLVTRSADYKIQVPVYSNVPQPVITPSGIAEGGRTMTLIGTPIQGLDGSGLSINWKQLSQYGSETNLPGWATVEGNKLKLTLPAYTYANDYSFRFYAGDKLVKRSVDYKIQVPGYTNVPQPVITPSGIAAGGRTITLTGSPTKGLDGVNLSTTWKQVTQYGSEINLPNWATVEGNTLKLVLPAYTYANDYSFRFKVSDKLVTREVDYQVKVPAYGNITTPVITPSGVAEGGKEMILTATPTQGVDGSKLTMVWKEMYSSSYEANLPNWAVAEGNKLKLQLPPNADANEFTFRVKVSDKLVTRDQDYKIKVPAYTNFPVPTVTPSKAGEIMGGQEVTLTGMPLVDISGTALSVEWGYSTSDMCGRYDAYLPSWAKVENKNQLKLTLPQGKGKHIFNFRVSDGRLARCGSYTVNVPAYTNIVAPTITPKGTPAGGKLMELIGAPTNGLNGRELQLVWSYIDYFGNKQPLPAWAVPVNEVLKVTPPVSELRNSYTFQLEVSEPSSAKSDEGRQPRTVEYKIDVPAS